MGTFLGVLISKGYSILGSILGYPLNYVDLTQRVQVPNNQVLGFWVMVFIVQALGKYMIIGYLDP